MYEMSSFSVFCLFSFLSCRILNHGKSSLGPIGCLFSPPSGWLRLVLIHYDITKTSSDASAIHKKPSSII